MRPIRIYIDNYKELENQQEVKYIFKTLLTAAGLPCHFVSDGNRENIDILYSNAPENTEAKMWIHASSPVNYKPVFHKESNGVFLFKSGDDDKEPDVVYIHDSVIIYSDIILTAYYFLSGQHEKGIPRNTYGHHAVENISLYKDKILHIPFINSYINLIRKLFMANNPADIFPAGRNCMALLTHDVDYPEMIRPLEALRYIYENRKFSPEKTIEVLTGKESFWKFNEYLELEGSHNFKSAFYFCSYYRNFLNHVFLSPDVFYNIRKNNFRELFKALQNNGNEISLHASYNAYKSKKQFLREKKDLEGIISARVIGNRHHYWHWNQDAVEETSLIHQEISLLYDASLCYEKRSGFRYGIAFPFHIYHKANKVPLAIIQLPTCIMDDHFFGYKKYSYFGDYRQEIDEIINYTLQWGGIINVDYHARVLNETFYPGWKESYLYILEKLSEKNIPVNTPENITKYWMEREKKINGAQVDEYINVNALK
ncbi:MAG: hypothetical protein ACLQQ4_10060 [Bacteroidia bacterium]